MVYKLRTLETRWFFSDHLPHEIEKWFGMLGQPECYPARTDLYLLGAGEALGIKLREGQIEVKQRTGEHGRRTFSAKMTGMVEEWVKWSLVVAGSTFENLSRDAAWLAVKKTRQQFTFALAESGQIEFSRVGEFLTNGGSLELTQLSVNSRFWWTIGVEVFSQEGRFAEVFEKIMKLVIEFDPDLQLESTHSMAYPAWLKQSTFLDG